jgi:protein-L-isoaspartate(D-aspartate) O-methyltransferase
VFSIERHEKLYTEARERLERLGIPNLTLELGDGSQGWPQPRVFDRIMVTAAAAETPIMLLKQLAVGGRLIAPVGSRPEKQRLVQFDRTPTGISKQELLSVRFVPLVEDDAL